MAVSYVGAHAIAAATATTTAVTNNVPAGTANGDLMLWHLTGTTTTQPATPTGWAVWQAVVVQGTTQGLTVFSRTAASEPASYTATVASAKWNGIIYVVRGHDTTTTKDAANTSAVGTGAVANPAITTTTANAWVVGANRALSASGVTNTTWTSSNGTLRAQVTQTLANTNVTSAVTDLVQAAAGSATPNLAASGTVTGSIALTQAIRAAAVAAAGRVRTMSKRR